MDLGQFTEPSSGINLEYPLIGTAILQNKRFKTENKPMEIGLEDIMIGFSFFHH